MADEQQVNKSKIRLELGDITDIDIECFVYYARSDLKLGSGFGGAISVRGGPSIQAELDEIGGIGSTEAVVTGAGELKAKYIIHANGPKFQEEDIERKLKDTILNVLKAADSKGIRQIALPPMGTGFYGVPLNVSADICLGTAQEYLQNNTNISEVVFCLLDNREYKPFKNRLSNPA